VTADARTDHGRVAHRLSAAIRFVDAFTAKAVAQPLDVRAETLPVVLGMPNPPWKAVRGPNDDTYRFLVTNNTVAPVGPIPISVSAPGEEYASFELLEPFTVTLPRPIVAHPPTPDRSDFLVERTLWPTRLLKVPPGETAIVGRVTNATGPVPALKVRMGKAPGPLPAAPYTYTSDSGEFVIRLPGLKTVNGGVPTTTASLLIELLVPPAYAVTVAPTAPVFPITVRLGQVTTLQITVP
jgi:hypothetical protein